MQLAQIIVAWYDNCLIYRPNIFFGAAFLGFFIILYITLRLIQRVYQAIRRTIRLSLPKGPTFSGKQVSRIYDKNMTALDRFIDRQSSRIGNLMKKVKKEVYNDRQAG